LCRVNLNSNFHSNQNDEGGGTPLPGFSIFAFPRIASCLAFTSPLGCRPAGTQPKDRFVSQWFRLPTLASILPFLAPTLGIQKSASQFLVSYQAYRSEEIL
jgi:hypothetical protein